jgi:hypothetical protein
MAANKKSTAVTKRGQKLASQRKPKPASLAIAKRGIRTANDFANLMGALMGDLLEGSVTAEVGNSTCKAGSNLLKAVEMQHKYGSAQPVTQGKVLAFATPQTA